MVRSSLPPLVWVSFVPCSTAEAIQLCGPRSATECSMRSLYELKSFTSITGAPRMMPLVPPRELVMDRLASLTPVGQVPGQMKLFFTDVICVDVSLPR
jgi:hypothetical protein